jgi:hypothetical protein
MTENHTIKSPSAAAEPSLFCPPQLIAGEDPVVGRHLCCGPIAAIKLFHGCWKTVYCFRRAQRNVPKSPVGKGSGDAVGRRTSRKSTEL